MSDWQPIETAPRDGTEICVFVPGNQQTKVFSVHWDEKFDFSYPEGFEGPVYRGAWTDDSVASWACEETAEYHPTHWQPLPPLPTP